jgi:4-hydroxy-2-oxovalerate aldolase
LEILDCTLRDGANTLGKGFNIDQTKVIIDGLVENGITAIEMGNPKGLGATTSTEDYRAPNSDREYLELAAEYRDKASVGMFVQSRYVDKESLDIVKNIKPGFLRIGVNAGTAANSRDLFETIRNAGIEIRCSLMKAYTLSAVELKKEAKLVEAFGAKQVSIMDSAGMMLPSQVEEYVNTVKEGLHIELGFHAHNNLGLAVANSLTAVKAGADSIDSSLCGLGRSAGNAPTEALLAVFERAEIKTKGNLMQLLSFINNELPGEILDHCLIKPLDLILGYSGCHSSFTPKFKKVAAEFNVSVEQLIVEVSKINKTNPDEALMRREAEKLSL